MQIAPRLMSQTRARACACDIKRYETMMETDTFTHADYVHNPHSYLYFACNKIMCISNCIWILHKRRTEWRTRIYGVGWQEDWVGRSCVCVWCGALVYKIIFLVGWIIIKTLNVISTTMTTDERRTTTTMFSAWRKPRFVFIGFVKRTISSSSSLSFTLDWALLHGHKISIRICILHYYLPNDLCHSCHSLLPPSTHCTHTHTKCQPSMPATELYAAKPAMSAF